MSAYFGRSFSESSISFVARASCSGVTPGTPDTSIGCDGSHGRGQLAVERRPTCRRRCGCAAAIRRRRDCRGRHRVDGSVAGVVAVGERDRGAVGGVAVRLRFVDDAGAAAAVAAWLWLCTWVPLLSIAGMVSAAMASAGNKRCGAVTLRLPTIAAAKRATDGGGGQAGRTRCRRTAVPRGPRGRRSTRCR